MYYYHTCPPHMSSNRCTGNLYYSSDAVLFVYTVNTQLLHRYMYTSIYINIYYIICNTISIIYQRNKKSKDFSYAFMHNFHVWLRYGYIFLLFFYTCVYGTDVHTHDHLLPPPLLPFFFFFCFPPPLSWPPRFPLP